MTYLDPKDYTLRREGNKVLLCREGLTINLTAMFGDGREPETAEDACSLIMRHIDYLWRLGHSILNQ